MKWWQSIKFKMVRDLALAAVVPLMLFAVVSLATSARSLEVSARENLELVARVTATRLDQLLAGGSALTGTLARDEGVVALCRRSGAGGGVDAAAREAVTRQLNAGLLADAQLAQVTVLDMGGVGIASTNPDDLGLDLSFRPYFKVAAGGRAYISDVLVGNTTLRPGVFFSMPVRDVPADAGEDVRSRAAVVGVLVVKLQGEKLWEIIEGAQVGRAGYTVLIDEVGLVLAHRKHEHIFSSLGVLTDEQIKEIDPVRRLMREGVPSLGKGALWEVVRKQSAGAGMFTLPAGVGHEGGEWAAGFHRMSAKPWRVVAIEPQSQFAGAVLAQRQTLLTGVGLVGLSAVVVALWRARRLVGPAVELTAAAERLAGGDFAARVEPKGGDEIARLGEVFNQVGPRLKEQVELARAMQVAVEVQDSLLPSAPPEVEGLELAGRSFYCDATGGDYYDFLATRQLGDGRVMLAVGDVMGHGIGSALLMAATRAALWAEVENCNDVCQTLARINRVLARNARHGKFVTLQLFWLDPVARTATWASAGHDPAIVYDPATETFSEMEGGGVPLGIFEDAEYESYHSAVPMPLGAIIVIGTDGIWEAVDRKNNQFEKERLRQLIRENAGRSCQEIATAIVDAVKAWRDGGVATDDVTLIVARLVPVGVATATAGA